MKASTLISLFLFLGAVTWVLTLSPPTVRKVQETYYRSISPFLKSGSSVEKFSRDFVREVEHSDNLQRRLEAINSNYNELKLIEVRFRELEREVQQLNQALDFKRQTPFEVRAAKVIKRQPSTWWDTITVNQGQDAEIGPQLTVLAEGGLVGRVDQAFDDISNHRRDTRERNPQWRAWRIWFSATTTTSLLEPQRHLTGRDGGLYHWTWWNLQARHFSRAHYRDHFRRLRNRSKGQTKRRPKRTRSCVCSYRRKRN